MSQTDLLLITGFLGAGKTTFLTVLLERYRGRRLHVIVNEFGKAGMDGTLLTGLGAAVKEISGGSVFCACRLEEFEAALSAALADAPDMILVEASGLSDPTAIRQIARRYPQIDYMGCVALADAPRVAGLLSTSRMAAKQLAVAGLILLNKTDLVDPAALRETQAMLRERFPQAELRLTRQGAFEDEWLEHLKPQAQSDAAQGGHERDVTLQKACVTVSDAMTSAQLKQFLRLFAEDTYRVKGLVRLKDGAFRIDGVFNAVEVLPYAGPLPQEADQITALAGAGMALMKSIQKAREWYPALITRVE